MLLLGGSRFLGRNLSFSVVGFARINPGAKLILSRIPWAELIRSLSLCLTGLVLLGGGGFLGCNLSFSVVRLPLGRLLLRTSLLLGGSLLSSNLGLSVVGFARINPGAKLILSGIPWAELIRSLSLRITGLVLLLGSSSVLRGDLGLGVVTSLKPWDYGASNPGS